MSRLLLLSNSSNFNQKYLTHAKIELAQFLGEIKEVLFIPFAGVTITYDEYEEKVQKAFDEMGVKVNSIHRFENYEKAVSEAKAIVIGGGNTFRLMSLLQENNLMRLIKKTVKSGTPYIGWSAGANIAGLSIKTTNDMPIDEPKSFKALELVPIQINPHFSNAVLPNHNGETRLQRLQEFAQLNPNVLVIGLPEGTWLRFENGVLNYHGDKDYLMIKGINIHYSQNKQII
jgi:dipeptidase E